MASQSELKGVLNVNSSIQTIFPKKEVFREEKIKEQERPSHLACAGQVLTERAVAGTPHEPVLPLHFRKFHLDISSPLVRRTWLKHICFRGWRTSQKKSSWENKNDPQTMTWLPKTGPGPGAPLPPDACMVPREKEWSGEKPNVLVYKVPYGYRHQQCHVCTTASGREAPPPPGHRPSCSLVIVRALSGPSVGAAGPG